MLFFDYAKIERWAEMAVQICHKDVQICHNADKQGHSSHAFLFLFFRCFSVFRWRHSITFSEICVERSARIEACRDVYLRDRHIIVFKQHPRCHAQTIMIDEVAEILVIGAAFPHHLCKLISVDAKLLH
jgi:hypothetical protein